MLFDAAGTLIELREPVGETYARVAREFDVELSARRLDEAFRHAFRAAPAMAFPGETPERIRELERNWWLAVVRRTIQSAGDGLPVGAIDRGAREHLRNLENFGILQTTTDGRYHIPARLFVSWLSEN